MFYKLFSWVKSWFVSPKMTIQIEKPTIYIQYDKTINPSTGKLEGYVYVNVVWPEIHKKELIESISNIIYHVEAGNLHPMFIECLNKKTPGFGENVESYISSSFNHKEEDNDIIIYPSEVFNGKPPQS